MQIEKTLIKMDTVAYTNSTETMRASRIQRGRKASVAAQAAIEKTPESELMSVDKYFGILRKRVNEYYIRQAKLIKQ